MFNTHSTLMVGHLVPAAPNRMSGGPPRDAQQVAGATRTAFVEATLEPACSASRNRLMRTRMLGGVGRVPGNGRPYPIYASFLSCDVAMTPISDFDKAARADRSSILSQAYFAAKPRGARPPKNGAIVGIRIAPKAVHAAAAVAPCLRLYSFCSDSMARSWSVSALAMSWDNSAAIFEESPTVASCIFPITDSKR